MNWHKVNVIVHKEWAEVFKNRMVLFTVAFLPLLMTAIPLAIIYGTGQAGIGNTVTSEVPAEAISAMCPPGLKGGECFQVFMVSQFMLMFMILPMAIPGTIAAYSIVGEKTTRSLEPLLATPITTAELLVGKCLSAVIPAVIATYGAFALFALGSWILVTNKTLLSALLDARWLIAIGIVGPLLAILEVTFALMVSSRVTDPRVAEQISMVIIVPLLAGFFGQMAGFFILDRNLILVIAIILVGIDALMAYFATQVFQREAILTRWK
jgi:ABC-2 type transport system permease protein